MRILYILSLLLLTLVNVWSQKVETIVIDDTKDFEAIHWGQDGRIYITDYTQGNIYKMSIFGSVQTVVSGFTATAGGGFDKKGNFYFSAINKGELLLLTPQNTHTVVGSNFNQPIAILPIKDTEDEVYITEYGSNEVSRLNLTTKESSLVVKNQGIFGPDAIIYDWDDQVLVSNYNNHRIYRLEEDGSVSLFAQIPAGGFMGYIILAGDYIYVPSISTRKVYRIDRSGQIEHILGSGLNGDDDGVGLQTKFRGPNGICASPSGDTLLIADDHRIRMVTQLNVTGVVQYNLELDNFTAVPNPVTDLMTMSFGIANSEELFYQIIGFDGKLHKERVAIRTTPGINKVDIDCSSLTSGLYFIQIENQRGHRLNHNFYKT